jgi:hypothetical protein
VTGFSKDAITAKIMEIQRKMGNLDNQRRKITLC